LLSDSSNLDRIGILKNIDEIIQVFLLGALPL
jgi:hypothetical protein